MVSGVRARAGMVVMVISVEDVEGGGVTLISWIEVSLDG